MIDPLHKQSRYIFTYHQMMIGAHSSVGAVCRVHATSTAMNLLTVLLFH